MSPRAREPSTNECQHIVLQALAPHTCWLGFWPLAPGVGIKWVSSRYLRELLEEFVDVESCDMPRETGMVQRKQDGRMRQADEGGSASHSCHKRCGTSAKSAMLDRPAKSGQLASWTS